MIRPSHSKRNAFTLILSLLILCPIASAQIFVTSTAGSGPGTLQDAIDQANLIPVAEESIVTIDLAPIQMAAAPARAVVNLSNSLFPNRSIYITATGGPVKPHIFFLSREAISIGAQQRPTTMIFENLRFEGARNISNLGGALRCNSGSNPLTLEISHCEFVDNQLSPDPLALPDKSGLGGAIYFASSLPAYPGTLKLKHCLFENNQVFSNTATGSHRAEGSAVFVKNSKLSIEDTVFLSNACDATLATTGGALRILGSSGTAEVRRCTFESNRAPLLPDDLAMMGVSAMMCSADQDDPVGVSILVEDSMFENNSGTTTVALGYGYEYSSATATFRNSTFVGNSGDSSSALSCHGHFGTISLSHCTVWDNQHEWVAGSAVLISEINNLLTLDRCVIAGNRRTADAKNNGRSPDVRQRETGPSSLVSGGYNFIGDAGGNSAPFTATGDRTGTFSVPILPRLANPGNYGGPTRSCPPLPDSPLVDFIPNVANVLLTDQLGIVRPQGFTADIGAVELPRTSYDVWDNQIPLTADRDASDDPDRDGLQNRQEYFFGTHPMVANVAPVRIVENEDGRFLEVIRSATVRPLYFTRTAVESSTDLTSGSWSSPTGTTLSSPETEGSLDRIRTLYPVGTDLRRFFRVAVE